MSRVYRFKVFKKTTKFKRYNKGVTRFIINRKKYVLRKKRTSLQLKFNLTYYWTHLYSLLRNYARFTQSLNLLNHTLTLSSKLYVKKISTSLKGSNISKVNDSFFSLTTVKKKLYFNKSLYFLQQIKGLNSIFNNTHVGFINFNNIKGINEIFNFGLSTDFKSYYPLELVNTLGIDKLRLIYWHAVLKRLLLMNMCFLKNIRKILILTLLLKF